MHTQPVRWSRLTAVCLGGLGLVLAVGGGPQSAAEEVAGIPQPAFPERHPYLALTPADVAQARDRVARYAWAKQAM